MRITAPVIALTIASIGVVAGGVLMYLGATFYGLLSMLLLTLPSLGVLVHTLVYTEWPIGTDTGLKRCGVFVSALSTSVGLILASLLIQSQTEGFLGYFFFTILVVLGFIELGSGVVYLFIGERLSSIIRRHPVVKKLFQKTC